MSSAWLAELTFWEWVALIAAVAMLALAVWWARHPDRQRDGDDPL